jgi:hypothetical protein
MQWGETGPAALPIAMRCRERTQQPKALLAFASRGSGPDRPLLGLLKSSSGTLGIGDGQHEAHFARDAGPIGDNLMAAPVPCSAGRSAGPNGPPMAGAGPSVGSGH